MRAMGLRIMIMCTLLCVLGLSVRAAVNVRMDMAWTTCTDYFHIHHECHGEAACDGRVYGNSGCVVYCEDGTALYCLEGKGDDDSQ